MSNDKLVSVVIPTYNRAETICRTVDSVLNQTYPNIEVIVVDDGSTDDTRSILNRYGNRIRIAVQDNAGPSIARNRGIALARGEMVAFLDSDDYWLPNKLTCQLEAMEKAGPVVCCICNCEVRYKNGERSSTFQIARIDFQCETGVWLNPAEILTTRFVLFNQAVVVRREALERIGCFEETLSYLEDYELSLRLALEGPWSIIRDELVVYHAASPGSLVDRARREHARLCKDLLQIKGRMLARVERSPGYSGLRKLAKRELRRARRELIAAELMAKSIAGATTVGRLLHFYGRVNQSIFRRSPLYPRPSVRPLS